MSTFRSYLRLGAVHRWRAHAHGHAWQTYRFLPVGFESSPLLLFRPARRRADLYSKFEAFRAELLDQEPNFIATPPLENIRRLAGDPDFRAYLDGRSTMRAWAISNAIYDASLIALALALLPELPSIVLEHFTSARPRVGARDVRDVLAITARDTIVLVAPCLPDTPTQRRLLEHGDGVVLRTTSTLARAS